MLLVMAFSGLCLLCPSVDEILKRYLKKTKGVDCLQYLRCDFHFSKLPVLACDGF